MNEIIVSSHHLVTMFIAGLTAALLSALAALVLWRVVDELRYLRRQQLIARYRALVDAFLPATPDGGALARLAAIPRRHRAVVADLILASLRLTTGDVVPRLRQAAATIGALDLWRRQLTAPRWWVRTHAVRCLGLVRDADSVDRLLDALDEPHEEVRAAAIDALGRIGDPRCGAALVQRLRDETRHQRTRLVEAIRSLGASVVPVLLTHAEEQPSNTALVADLIGVVGGTSAIDRLINWTSSEDAEVRAAALRAIGAVGLDDRSFFYALRGLEDENATVRGMAARALGRSGRSAAVPYLASHLDDEWLVAAHCAAGLRRLGRPGVSALETRAGDTGQGAELARQMLWELTFLKVGA